MKALVNYCRWNRAKLRLMGREEGLIYGQLVFNDHRGQQQIKEFRFATTQSELTIKDEAGSKTIVLDEMGIPTDR
ncbi:MAG: hypothetical protein R3293_00705 [Candidatus Promineifilaceae bacterium]|nr:hypothetical protein [Candidatus Promineifilaceae bacterium]